MDLKLFNLLGYLAGAGGTIATAFAIVYSNFRTQTLKTMTTDRDAWRDRAKTLEGERDRSDAEVKELRDWLNNLEGQIKVMKDILQGRDPEFITVVKRLDQNFERHLQIFTSHIEEYERQFSQVNRLMTLMTDVLKKNTEMTERIMEKLPSLSTYEV